MRKITMGLTGFAGALVLIASMGSAIAGDRDGTKFQHDRGFSKGPSYHLRDDGDRDRHSRKAQKRQHAEHRDHDRHGKKHRKHKKRRHAHEKHHDKHARHHHKRHHDKHARRHHKRHHDKHARRHHKRHHKHHGHHDRRHGAGIDLGALTLFFGQSQYRQDNYSQGYNNVSQVCQDVSKVGWWNGQKALIGGTGCYDQYGNLYVVEGSRYLIRYVY